MITYFQQKKNQIIERPLPLFISFDDQTPVRGRPDSKICGAGRPESVLPTHRENEHNFMYGKQDVNSTAVGFVLTFNICFMENITLILLIGLGCHPW